MALRIYQEIKKFPKQNQNKVFLAGLKKNYGQSN